MVAPVWKQWYIAGCTLFLHFATGIVLGFPAILTPALTAEDSDIPATRDEASWIAAAYSITGIAAYIVMPALLQIYGRKCVNVISNLSTFIGSLIIAVAPNITCLLAGRIIQGISFGGMYICCLIVAEYVHPKRRGFFVSLKMFVFIIGILTCHSLSVFLTWRQMAWLAAVPSVIGGLSTLTWPESPSWLAYKERYDECSAAFEWLRGNDYEARKELKELIIAQKELNKLKVDYNKNTLKSVLGIFRRPEFLKPFFISCLLVVLIHTFGHHYLLAYVIEIMTQLTGDKSKGYFYTLGFDVMKLISSLASAGVMRVFKRRTVVFFAGSSACLTLGLICISNLLEDKELLPLKWLTPLLLIVFSVICYAGFIPVAIVIKGEIFPIQYKGLGTASVGVINASSSLAAMKLTSTMLVTLEAHGTFGVYLVISAACLLCLYFILPETKDRTLQDIEMEFFGFKLANVDDETLVLELKETKHFVEKTCFVVDRNLMKT